MPCDARTSAVGRQGCKGRVIHNPDKKSSMLIHINTHIGCRALYWALCSPFISLNPSFRSAAYSYRGVECTLLVFTPIQLAVAHGTRCNSAFCGGRPFPAGSCPAALDAHPQICVRAQTHAARPPGTPAAVHPASPSQVQGPSITPCFCPALKGSLLWPLTRAASQHFCKEIMLQARSSMGEAAYNIAFTCPRHSGTWRRNPFWHEALIQLARRYGQLSMTTVAGLDACMQSSHCCRRPYRASM